MSVTGSPVRRAGRFAAVTAAAGAVVVVVVGGTVAANAAMTSSQQAAAQPVAQVRQDASSVTLPHTVTTGLTAPAGELVLTVQEVTEAQLPQTRFGVMLGVRSPSGQVEDLIMANEAGLPDVEAGFHAVQAPATINGTPTPEFGYYAGPAARVTGKTPAGTTIEATPLAPIELFGTPVVLFWFDPAVTGPCGDDQPGVSLKSNSDNPAPAQCDITDLAAFDAAGVGLPIGSRPGVGHG
ncbi:hypothetical protein [Catenuloplanes japonicus]|uniref:hypothetical protein n=1 Tax=Catenuloplanes japonicus TaxID=33876 RepID=UPI00068E65FA|nr:hypothetical protein [Catenuloplanes japonicus]